MIDGFLNQILCDDCSVALQKIPDNSIDLLVTDPPYGYSFMGKEWDKAIVNTSIWKECLRVLKPGAFSFIMSAPRQDVLSKMISNLIDAGFETSFTSIYWTYASGFPKAMNVSKAIDKRAGVEREVIGKYKLPNGSEWNLKQAENSEVEHSKPTFTASGNRTLNITAPTTDEAKKLSGSYGGFQPKPAIEVIIVAMKPITEQTYIEQALQNEKGVTWLDDCRIPFQSEEDKESSRFGVQQDIRGGNLITPIGIKAKNVLSSEDGRFPANLIVSDDILNDGKERRTGQLKEGLYADVPRPDRYMGYEAHSNKEYKSDTGSHSRYFDLDRWFDNTIKTLPEEVLKTFPFLIVPKASRSEKNKGLDKLESKEVAYSEYRDNYLTTKSSVTLYPDGTSRPVNKTKNPHPTVKPIKLMSYLITLGSRKEDIILDPFCGSGTTCIAAKILNRNFIGIEKEIEYKKIGDLRLTGHEPEEIKDERKRNTNFF